MKWAVAQDDLTRKDTQTLAATLQNNSYQYIF